MQLSTYDAVKSWLQRRVGLTDGLPLVTAASFVTGAAVVGAMREHSSRPDRRLPHRRKRSRTFQMYKALCLLSTTTKK